MLMMVLSVRVGQQTVPTIPHTGSSRRTICPRSKTVGTRIPRHLPEPPWECGGLSSTQGG